MQEKISKVLIRDILDITQFKKIQNELASIVDISIVTTDPDGIPIGELSNFSSFCQLVRSSPQGRKSCEASDKEANKRSLKAGKPLVYNCPCMLRDCTAPIVVEGVHVGSVLGGQVIVREEDRDRIDTQKLSKKFGISKEELDKRVAEIKVVPEEYLQRSLRFYSFLARYSAESGLKNIVQKELETERQELDHLQQIACEQELKRMQAQMNPHFLFNSLNSIARSAYLEDAPQTEQLIYSLASYLRYSIKNTEAMQKLSSEIENLNSYLSIQKIRFGERIHFSLDIAPEILDWYIPSMTLQPIVENAINHGLENKAEGGFITVSGKVAPSGDEMLVTIYDNGVGFPKDLLTLFQEVGNKKPFQLGLGLHNTHQRIKRLCGDQYGLHVESKQGQYTLVSLQLPKKLES